MCWDVGFFGKRNKPKISIPQFPTPQSQHPTHPFLPPLFRVCELLHRIVAFSRTPKTMEKQKWDGEVIFLSFFFGCFSSSSVDSGTLVLLFPRSFFLGRWLVVESCFWDFGFFFAFLLILRLLLRVARVSPPSSCAWRLPCSLRRVPVLGWPGCAVVLRGVSRRPP